MPNSYINGSRIAKTFLARFQNKTRFALTAARDFTEDYENKGGMRLGSKIQYRLPYNFSVGRTLTVVPQSVNDRIRELDVNRLSNVALKFDGLEIKFEAVMQDPYKRESLVAQVDVIAADVENQIAQDMLNGAYNFVGTPGAGLTGTVLGKSRALCGKLGIDFGTLYGALSYDSSAVLTDTFSNSFNTKINTAALTEGYLGFLKGFELFETAYLPRHIAGIGAGQVVTAGKKSGGFINGSVTSGNTINIDGVPINALVFKKNDRFTIDGVYGVNFLTKQSTNELQGFVVKQDAVSNASGQVTITVDPGIIITGVFQNVSGQILDNSAVTMLTDHDISLFYNKQALYYAAPQLIPLEINHKGHVGYDARYRMYMTYNAGSDIINYTEIRRVDHLWGDAINGEFIVAAVS